MIRNRGEHDIHLLLNGAFRESFSEIEKRLSGLLPPGNVHVFQPLSPVHQADPENTSRRIASEIIREALIGRIEADIIHVTSHFEGYIDEAVTSFGRLASSGLRCVTLYDLIPHIHSQVYLSNKTVRSWYDERLLHLKRADLILTISSSSRQEAIDVLGMREVQTVNVGTAADSQFCPSDVRTDRKTKLLRKYSIRSKFIMYTGGIDYRKNLERLIEAFAKIPKVIRNDFSLAIICSCSDTERSVLQSVAINCGLSGKDFIMTGFVPDEDLIDLYRIAHHFVFPSWHEGFGLPALEAMSCGAPVIAADRSSLPEVIGRTDATFDPYDVEAVTVIMTRVITDTKFRKDLISFGSRQARNFSWDKTAKLAISAFENSARKHTLNAVNRAEASRTWRPRLAYVSPLPPARSGIADFSSEVLIQLTQYYDVDVVIQQGSDFIREIDTALLSVVHIISPADLIIHAEKYNRVMYHFGNSDHHGHMLELIRSVPGVIVLHDFFIGGLLALMQHVHGVAGLLDEAIYDSHGYGALADLKGRMDFQTAIWKYPCNLSVIRRALGVIVHSNHALDLARQWYGAPLAAKWRMIPLMRLRRFPAPRTSAGTTFDLDSKEFVICSFGGVGETKLSHKLLEAFKLTKCGRLANVKLIFVGAYPKSGYGDNLRRLIASHPFGDRINVTGWVDQTQYQSYLSSADLAIQLRTLSRGETSAAVLDCLNFGIPTIINAHGSMTEIPDNCVLKVADDFRISDLATAIDHLHDNSRMRTLIGREGREFIRRQHDPKNCAEAYRDAIEKFYEIAPFNASVVANNIGRACAQNMSEGELALASLGLDAMPVPGLRRPILIEVTSQLDPDDPCRVDSLHDVKKTIEEAERTGRPAVLVSRVRRGVWQTRHALALEAFGLPTDLLSEYRFAAFPEAIFAYELKSEVSFGLSRHDEAGPTEGTIT